MWPVSINWRVLCLVAVAVGVFAAGCWSGLWWKGFAVRGLQTDLRALQVNYQGLESKGKAEALQRLKDSVAKAQEVDRGYQTEIQALRVAAARPPRVIRLHCKTDPTLPSPGTGQAGDPPELAGESADGRGMGSNAGTVDLAVPESIILEAKFVSSRLRALQAVCQ